MDSADEVRLRPWLVYAYFDINLDVLWQTLTIDLPELIPAIESALPPGAQ